MLYRNGPFAEQRPQNYKRVRFDLPFFDHLDNWTEVACVSMKLPGEYTAMDAESYALLSLSRACTKLAEGAGGPACMPPGGGP